MNIGQYEVLILVVIALYVWALVVCVMKRRWVFFVLGILFGLFAFIGALLPPQPDSPWEKKRRAA